MVEANVGSVRHGTSSLLRPFLRGHKSLLHVRWSVVAALGVMVAARLSTGVRGKRVVSPPPCVGSSVPDIFHV